MTPSLHRFALLFAFSSLAFAATACRCGDGTTGTESLLRVVVPDAQEQGTVDFGEVRAGSGALRELRLENAGRGGLTLESPTEDGTGLVAIEDASASGRIFSLDELHGVELRGGESKTVIVRVQASATDKVTVRSPYETRLIFASVSGEKAGAILRVTVVPDECFVPDELNFGNLWSGTSADKALEFPSASPVEATTVELGPLKNLVGPDFIGLYDSNAIAAPAGTKVSIPFRVKAAGSQELRALIDVKRSDRCEAQKVTLAARSITEGLSVSPSPVDCGFVPMGLSKRVQATVTNIAPDTVTLSGFTALGPFSFESMPESLTLEGGASASLAIRCTPTAEGLDERILTFSTSQERQVKVSFPARVYGGGPDITVEPPSLAFGKVPWVKNASAPVPQQRTIRIRNEGTTVPDKSGHLYLGSQSGAGLASAFEVVPLNATTGASEFTVEPRTSYDSAIGVPPVVSGGPSIRVDVTLAPASTGLKSAELIIHSNDLDEPELRVPISAEVFEAPDCDYTLAPAALEFGITAYPGRVTRSTRFTNLGDGGFDDCYVTLIGVEPIGPDFHSPIFSAQLVPPGGHLDVPVTFSPDERPDGGIQPLSATLEFSVSSASAPKADVALAGTAGPPCLTVIPPTHDFGEVQIGCQSTPKALNLYNGCAVPISLSTATAAGVPYAVGDFDGGVDLPPFGGPTSVDVRFAPTALGRADGVAFIAYEQYDAGTVAAVPLHGMGVVSPQREDVFIQSAAPQLDLVVVYSDYEVSAPNVSGIELSHNADVLANLLLNSPIDFHVGVTWAGAALQYNKEPIPFIRGVRGAFLDEGSPSEPWLQRTTLDFATKFKARFFQAPQPRDFWDEVGRVRWETSMDNSCFEAMGRALTEPRISNENAGFRRVDVPVLGLCAMIHDDCSPQGAVGLTEPFFTSYAKLMAATGYRRDTMISSAVRSFQWPWPSCMPVGTPLRAALMAELTGGHWTYYYGHLWAAEMEDSLYATAGLPREFKLGAQPQSGTVEVLIDSVPVASSDSTGALVWAYDSSKNSVVFERVHRPAPGASVVIRYTPVCY